MHALVCPLCRIALPTVDDVCPRDGRVGVDAAWLAVPPTLSQRFRVLAPFAHGDTGSLYLVDEPETGRRGLLKVLAPALKEQLSERQRLRRELVKQATLQRTHLIAPLASGECDGFTWLFREWLDGVSLEVRLSREGALQQTEALAVAAQIASALDELHRGGLLHRDVKPGHIFLQPTPHGIPRAFLLDAGLTATLHTSTGGRLQGTPGYLAPEQLTGGLISFRSDLYSLGCVLYRMLTGQPAFAGETDQDILLAQRRAERPPIPATLPNGIGALLQSTLSKDPQERPFSAQKLRRTLAPFLPDGALMEKQPTSTFETLPEPRPSNAPQASGTLRPPPPPSARPGSPTHAPPAAAASIKAPPVPVQDRTVQLDLDASDLEEILPAPRRATSVPPPMPRADAGRASVPPPPRRSPVPPPPRKPAPPSEKTQPIRLDQILAVAAARHSQERAETASVPPAAPTAADKAVARASTSAATTDAVASDAAATRPAADLMTDAAQPSPARAAQLGPTDARASADQAGLEPSSLGLAAPSANQPAHDDSTSSSASLFATPDAAPDAPLEPARDLDGDATTEFSPARLFQHATAAQAARATAKATLLGIGADPLEQSGALSAAEPTSERDHPTERVSLASSELPRIDASQVVTGSMPATALHTLGGLRNDSRRLLMYASAALVGLGVLGMGASALLGGDKPAQPAAVAPPSLPAVEAKPQPKPAAAALAEAPRPAPTAIPEPAAAEPVEPTANEQAPSVKDSPRSAPESASSERRAHRSERSRDAARSHAKSRTSSAPSAKASKAAEPAGKDKSAQFADARDQARAFYAAKRYKEAAAAYERAARLDPSHAGTFAGLGAARLQVGDNKGALQAYQRAVQLSPETSGFQAALGRAYLANGDKSRAIAAYKRALSLDPKNEAAKTALQQLKG